VARNVQAICLKCTACNHVLLVCSAAQGAHTYGQRRVCRVPSTEGGILLRAVGPGDSTPGPATVPAMHQHRSISRHAGAMAIGTSEIEVMRNTIQHKPIQRIRFLSQQR